MPTPIDVLVIDHSDRDARTTLTGIRRCSDDATVLRVKDADDALDFVYRKGRFNDRAPAPPRVILLEVDLPSMSGLLLLDRLQHDGSTGSIPVVVLTSNVDALVRDDAYSRGARAFVAKSADKAEYIAAVASAVGQWLRQ